MPSAIPSFSRTIAAAHAVENCQRSLGDPLVAECGPPGEHGVNTGTYDLIRKAGTALRTAGFEYSIRRLEQLRTTAFKFPDRRRLRSVTWEAHHEAGGPDTLDRIVERANGKRITVKLVKTLRRSCSRGNGQSGSGPQPKPPDDADHVIAVTQALTAAGKAQGYGYDFERLLKPHVGQLTSESIEKLADAAEAVIADWERRLHWLRNQSGSHLREAAE